MGVSDGGNSPNSLEHGEDWDASHISTCHVFFADAQGDAWRRQQLCLLFFCVFCNRIRFNLVETRTSREILNNRLYSFLFMLQIDGPLSQSPSYFHNGQPDDGRAAHPMESQSCQLEMYVTNVFLFSSCPSPSWFQFFRYSSTSKQRNWFMICVLYEQLCSR